MDPFGHSKEMASLYAQMGLEAFFFSRLHYRDAERRRKDKAMNLLWRASPDLGSRPYSIPE